MAESLELEERRGSWWDWLFKHLIARSEEDMKYQLPADSLFNEALQASVDSIADVPEQIKAQIREEAVLSVMNRLESSLRLLLYATTPGKEPPTAEKCHQILNVWRYELEHRVHLVPDTYCGAVQRYETELDGSYTIDGRCAPGDLVRIRVPCWRMFERIVVRGEAERLDESEHGAPEAVAAQREAPKAAVDQPVAVEPEAAPAEALIETPPAAPPPVEAVSPTPATAVETPPTAPAAAAAPVVETTPGPEAAPPAAPAPRRIALIEAAPEEDGPSETLSADDEEVFAQLRGLPPSAPRSDDDA